MKIQKIIKNLKQVEDIKKIIKNGGFLISALSIINPENKTDEWNIGFYDPNTKKITEIHVNKNNVKIEKPDNPIREISEGPDENKIKISSEKALEIANKDFEKYKTKAKKIIISFQLKEKEIWNITFISNFGTLINVEIDAENGNVLNSEKKSLFENRSSTAS